MGVTTEYTFWCDTEDCPNWYQEGMAGTKLEAKKIAKKNGWKEKKDGWYCPECNKNNKEKG